MTPHLRCGRETRNRPDPAAPDRQSERPAALLVAPRLLPNPLKSRPSSMGPGQHAHRWVVQTIGRTRPVPKNSGAPHTRSMSFSICLRVWVLLVAMGCDVAGVHDAAMVGSDTEVPTVELFGSRAILQGDNGSGILQFDSDMTPRLRRSGTVSAGHLVLMGDDDLAIRPNTLHQTRAGHTLVTMMPPAILPPPGSGVVQWFEQGRLIAQWSVLWAKTPDKSLCRRSAIPPADKGVRLSVEACLQQMPPGERVWGLSGQGSRLYRAGRLDEALAAWRTTVDAALADGMPSEAASRLRTIAHVELERGRYDAAEQALSQARGIVQILGDPLATVRTLYYDGLLAKRLGRYRQTERMLARASEHAWALGFDGEAIQYGLALADLLAMLGRRQEAATRVATAAARLTPAQTGTRLEAQVHHFTGWLALRSIIDGGHQADLAAARVALTRAQALFAHVGLVQDEAAALADLAQVAWLSAQRPSARRLIARARAQNGGGRARVEGFLDLLDAELQLEDGDTDGARAGFARILAHTDPRRPGDPHLAWRARYGLGRALEQGGDAEAATAEFRTAYAEVERVARRVDVRDTRARFLHDRRPLALHLLTGLIERGDLSGAFAVAERLVAQPLLDLEVHLRSERLSVDDAQVWQIRLQQFRSLREAYTAAKAEQTTLSVDGLDRWRVEQQARARRIDESFDALDAWLEVRAPTLTRLVDIEAIQAALGPRQALVSVVPTARGRVVFWLDREHAAVEQRPANDPGALLAPWLDALAGIEHLYIVPGGAPEAAALPGVEIAGAPLIDHASVSFVPYAGWLARSRPVHGGQPLIIADPGQNLPEAQQLAAWLQGRFPSADLLEGNHAVRGSVLAALRGTPWLHFAGHGDVRSDNPWAARLRLADDQALTLTDLLVDPPRVDLVVLSGCRTGVRGAPGAGIQIGLPDGFLLAGTHAVVATTQEIDDRLARRFAEQFYARNGTTRPGEAMRGAIGALRKEHPDITTTIQLWGRPRIPQASGQSSGGMRSDLT